MGDSGNDLSVIELVPESYVAPLDLAQVFGRSAPLGVDLGCGDGGFVVALATRHPDKNFLGIERQAGRVAKTCRKAAALGNVRVLHLESSYAVRYLLPEKSVESFYLLFPDPWPKRRHQARRVGSPEFLLAVHRALVSGGLLYLATDQRNYFQQIERIALTNSQFERIDIADNLDLPPTKFENQFRQQDAPIYRLALRKVSPVM